MFPASVTCRNLRYCKCCGSGCQSKANVGVRKRRRSIGCNQPVHTLSVPCCI